jgi:peptide deformylase
MPKTWTLWEDGKINESETKILRRIADEVPVPYNEEGMRDIMKVVASFLKRDDAAGLAAPQIGISKRIIVFKTKVFGNETQIQRNNGDYEVLVNPRITQYRGDKELLKEGCLSCPDISVDVVRATSIKVKGYDMEGRKINKRYSGYLARVVQHEVDHLDGKLIVDRGRTVYFPKEKEEFFQTIFQGEE